MVKRPMVLAKVTDLSLAGVLVQLLAKKESGCCWFVLCAAINFEQPRWPPLPHIKLDAVARPSVGRWCR